MATYVTPKVNTQFIFYIPLISQSNPLTFQSNPTIASGDFKVSTDGSALANLGTLPSVDPASSKAVKITLSASEMNGANIQVIASDAAGAEWCDAFINIQTTARQVDDLAFPNTSGRGLDVSTDGDVEANVTKINGSLTSGNNATLSLKQLNIVNNAGTAFIAHSTGSGGNGMHASANGSGAGFRIDGDSTDALLLQAGSAGAGLGAYGPTSGTGNGIYAEGGGTAGAGIKGVGLTNSAGLEAVGDGTGAGIQATAGVTGVDIAGELGGMTVETYAEPTGVPAATATLASKIGRGYQVLIEGLIVDSNTNELQLKNAAGTVIWKKTITDAAGVYTESGKTAP